MASYASSDDEVSGGVVASPVRPQNLFSDSDDDDRGKGRVSEAEEDNSLNRREGGGASGQVYKSSGDEEEERKKEDKKKKDEKKKPKGPVRRQMISEDMLIGKNGISAIPEIFKDFKFRGKGREREDLDNVLSKLEHWIHLLHPKHPFDQCLQRIEFLGSKRKVIKTHMKKIRMGMLNNYDEADLVVEEDDDMMNNIDATELAESASAFVNESESVASQIPSTSSMLPTTTQMNKDSEFPDDDDDYYEPIGESSIVKTKAAVNDLDEMEIDMEDIPQDSDEEDDDIFMKQMEAQLKRAKMVETQQQQQKQSNEREPPQDKQPEQPPTSPGLEPVAMESEETITGFSEETISGVSEETISGVSEETISGVSEVPNASPNEKDEKKTDFEPELIPTPTTPTTFSKESKAVEVDDDDDGIMLDELCDNDDD